MSKQVIYLSEEKPFFSKQYLKVRELENRVLSDSEVKQLPLISEKHPHYREWQLRQKTSNRFLKYLSDKTEAQTILDIGCGNGWFTNTIAEISVENEVFGLDVNPLELEQAIRVFQAENCTFYYGNLFEIKGQFNQKFTLIILNACVQYFEDFEKLIEKLKTFLKPNGEIHIIDSPFYKLIEVNAAKQRTHDYFKKMGVIEMSDFYFHHSLKMISDFEILYQPKNKLFAKISQKKDSPFMWLRLTFK